MSTEEKKVTISSNWVLITEPSEQQIYSVDQYSTLLKKYECLKSIPFFKHFIEAKVVAKWRHATEANQIKNNKIKVESKIKKVFRNTYLDLVFLL